MRTDVAMVNKFFLSRRTNVAGKVINKNGKDRGFSLDLKCDRCGDVVKFRNVDDRRCPCGGKYWEPWFYPEWQKEYGVRPTSI